MRGPDSAELGSCRAAALMMPTDHAESNISSSDRERQILSSMLSAAGLRIKENKEVYEGEVTEMTPEETEAPGGGFQKAISHVVIGLRTVSLSNGSAFSSATSGSPSPASSSARAR